MVQKLQRFYWLQHVQNHSGGPDLQHTHRKVFEFFGLRKALRHKCGHTKVVFRREWSFLLVRPKTFHKKKLSTIQILYKFAIIPIFS